LFCVCPAIKNCPSIFYYKQDTFCMLSIYLIASCT
jgi:hypothetical protein